HCWAMHVTAAQLRQNWSKDCQSPKLRHVFLVPQQENYENGSSIFYGCDANTRPVANAWWGVLRCDDGVWSHTPHCLGSIGESECAAPAVSHAQPLHKLEGWYSNNSRVPYACEKGYELVGKQLAVCINGKWILPECKRKLGTCDAPAPVANAVIIQPYQDVFEHTDRVDFMCKKGYKLAGHRHNYCMNEEWTPAPICGVCPKTRKATATCTGEGRSSTGQLCGTYPAIENGDVFEVQDGRALTVQCVMLYKLDGPKSIMCVNEEWTTLPVCKAPCKLDQTLFYYQQAEYISHGDQMNGHCTNYWNYMYVICNNGRALYRGCKFNIPMQLGQECILSLFKISHLSTVSINFLLTIT
uniref:Sushi domain-containing protein n=1 Tax=Electrophorus electricus TaxID=8005 RepID=A0A4W4GHA2_ELEEL